MNLKLNGAILLVGLALGYLLCGKFGLPNLLPPSASSGPQNPPPKKEARKIERSFENGKLAKEVVVEDISTPQPQLKPRYKITLMPVWSQSGAYYGGLYEKRYDVPVLRDVYIGVFANTRGEAGLSLSKEFY